MTSDREGEELSDAGSLYWAVLPLDEDEAGYHSPAVTDSLGSAADLSDLRGEGPTGTFGYAEDDTIFGPTPYWYGIPATLGLGSQPPFWVTKTHLRLFFKGSNGF